MTQPLAPPPAVSPERVLAQAAAPCQGNAALLSKPVDRKDDDKQGKGDDQDRDSRPQEVHNNRDASDNTDRGKHDRSADLKSGSSSAEERKVNDSKSDDQHKESQSQEVHNSRNTSEDTDHGKHDRSADLKSGSSSAEESIVDDSES